MPDGSWGAFALVNWQPRRPVRFRWLCALGCAAAVAVAGITGPNRAAAQERPKQPAHEPTGFEAAVALEKVLVDAIARNESSVVAIGLFRATRLFQRNRLEQPTTRPGLDDIPDAFGTGVVLDRAGLILTNYHVLREEMDAYIRAADGPFWITVRVKAADPHSDLAVLEIVEPDPAKLKLRPVTFGDASRLKRGQIVISLGNPYAIGRDGRPSAAWGIVSNLGRRLPPVDAELLSAQRPTIHHFGTLIQTDAKLNMGTSGGPLLNLKGEMIGLTTANAALAGYEKSAGFAVACDDIFRRVVDALVEGREVEFGFLGVEPEDVTHDDAVEGRRGVKLRNVVSGTPAFGLLYPRDVLTHVNDEPIQSATELMLAVGKRAAGERVRLTVLRGNQKLQVPITLSKNRVRGKQIVTTPSPAWRGLRVEYPTALRSLAQAETIPADCVIVTEAAAGSPAAAQGLHAGMRISHVEDLPVATPPEFMAAVANRKGPVRLRLTGPDADPPVRVIPPAAE